MKPHWPSVALGVCAIPAGAAVAAAVYLGRDWAHRNVGVVLRLADNLDPPGRLWRENVGSGVLILWGRRAVAFRVPKRLPVERWPVTHAMRHRNRPRGGPVRAPQRKAAKLP